MSGGVGVRPRDSLILVGFVGLFPSNFGAFWGLAGTLIPFRAFRSIWSMFRGKKRVFFQRGDVQKGKKFNIKRMKISLYNMQNEDSENSFERLGASNSLIDGLSEVEVGRESVSFNRYYVKFRRELTLVDSQLFTPELDALSLLELSSDSDCLFTSLVNAGLGSKLINHFAECESSGMDYTDVETGDVLMEKVFRNINKEKRGHQSEKGVCSESNTLYKLKSGMRFFHRILKLDKKFLLNILEGLKSGLCKLARVDLCIDLSEDIMPYVSHGIKTGQYKGFGRHPFAFGWLAGDRIEGAAGRNSKLFKDFDNKKLILDSVYFGNARKSDEVAVFYNKREERKDKAEASWAPKSRVEVRIYPRTGETEKVAISILESYLDEADGWRARIPHFGEVLCRCVVFTTKKRPTSPLDSKDVAPWWQLLLRALRAGSKGFEFPNEKGLLESNAPQGELTGLLPLIEVPRKGRGRPKGSKDKKVRKPGSGLKNFL